MEVHHKKREKRVKTHLEVSARPLQWLKHRCSGTTSHNRASTLVATVVATTGVLVLSLPAATTWLATIAVIGKQKYYFHPLQRSATTLAMWFALFSALPTIFFNLNQFQLCTSKTKIDLTLTTL